MVKSVTTTSRTRTTQTQEDRVIYILYTSTLLRRRHLNITNTQIRDNNSYKELLDEFGLVK